MRLKRKERRERSCWIKTKPTKSTGEADLNEPGEEGIEGGCSVVFVVTAGCADVDKERRRTQTVIAVIEQTHSSISCWHIREYISVCTSKCFRDLAKENNQRVPIRDLARNSLAFERTTLKCGNGLLL